MDKRNDDGHIFYRPLFYARVSSANQEPFIMRMTAEWFSAAKAHMNSPSLGRSVHHVKGHRVQRTLDLQVHYKKPTPNDWVGVRSLNKNGCCPKTPNCFKRMASLCVGIPCARLEAIYTPRIKKGPKSGNKGCPPKNRKK